ncbi:hypothetical protein WJX81_006605 [Elliptochloris bilobata]|uniref:Uncharacterized protein n=1 Tax=Elliptochloris bilobata TaxID=381761 RepID=A0AAW1RS79_9CHLO
MHEADTRMRELETNLGLLEFAVDSALASQSAPQLGGGAAEPRVDLPASAAPSTQGSGDVEEFSAEPMPAAAPGRAESAKPQKGRASAGRGAGRDRTNTTGNYTERHNMGWLPNDRGGPLRSAPLDGPSTSVARLQVACAAPLDPAVSTSTSGSNVQVGFVASLSYTQADWEPAPLERKPTPERSACAKLDNTQQAASLAFSQRIAARNATLWLDDWGRSDEVLAAAVEVATAEVWRCRTQAQGLTAALVCGGECRSDEGDGDFARVTVQGFVARLVGVSDSAAAVALTVDAGTWQLQVCEG